MSIRRIVRLGLVSAIGLLASACATTHFTRSGFRSVPPGVKGKAGAAASLALEGLKLRVESLDEAAKGQALPRLALRIAFEPRELGYSFDPSQVSVRALDGTSFRPLALPESRHLALAPGSSFDLAFDVTVTNEAELELKIAGLARGRKPLEALRLPLARRKGSRITRVYWLEALAYAAYAR
jgi:hypothetical protein